MALWIFEWLVRKGKFSKIHTDNKIAWTLVKPMMNNVLGIRRVLVFLIFPMSIIYLFFFIYYIQLKIYHDSFKSNFWCTL